MAGWPTLDSVNNTPSNDARRTTSSNGETWGWPDPSLAPLLISCRFVPRDQWFRTHIDPSWTVRDAKAHLLRKCRAETVSKLSALSIGSGPRRPTLSLRSSKRGRPSLKMVPTHSAIVEDTQGPLSMPHGQLPRTSVDLTTPETLGGSSASASDEKYSLFSFYNGCILDDDLPVWKYYLKPYDLLEIQAPRAYICFDRNISYMDPYFSCQLQLVTEGAEEFKALSLVATIQHGTMRLRSQTPESDEASYVLDLKALDILQEIPANLPPAVDVTHPPYCIKAGFRVPMQDKVWSSDTTAGRAYRFLLPDDATHDHLLRILSRSWCDNRGVIGTRQETMWRIKTYHRAIVRESWQGGRSESGEGTEKDFDLGAESEVEWEGWRGVYDSKELLRRGSSSMTSLEPSRTS